MQLEAHAHDYMIRRGHCKPSGALMISCLGRGNVLHGTNGVEPAILKREWGMTVPLAGFFATAEIGPVGYRSYTHSYTTALALFRPRHL